LDKEASRQMVCYGWEKLVTDGILSGNVENHINGMMFHFQL